MTHRSNRNRRVDWEAARERVRRNLLEIDRDTRNDPERREEVFRRRAERLAARRPWQPAADGSVSVLTITLGTERYGLPLALVASVRPLGELTAVPGGPPELVGVTHIDGAIRSVLDLARVIALPWAADRPLGAGGFIVMARGRSATSEEVGFRVDGVDAVVTITPESLRRPEEGLVVPVRFIQGVADGQLLVLDPAALLAHPLLDA